MKIQVRKLLVAFAFTSLAGTVVASAADLVTSHPITANCRVNLLLITGTPYGLLCSGVFGSRRQRTRWQPV